MINYTIRPGDTIYKLAAMFRTPVNAILSANPGLYPYDLLIGQTVRIPVGDDPPQTPPGVSAHEMALYNALRKLWTDHVAWTRMTILSAAADAPDLQMVTARLLRNASDMAEALKPYYGEAYAAQFGRLIYEHLRIALQLVTAAKAGNTQAAQQLEKEWETNADQIAQFLGTINPNIRPDEFRKMLGAHLSLTKEEAMARLRHDYARDIALYDQIEEQALNMADDMAAGIARQFPAVFR